MVGIDIIDINRVRKSSERTPRFLKRVFTEAELNYCFRKSNPYPSLAARFAAKEAVRKLDAAFTRGKYHDIEVIVDNNGKPVLNLNGDARHKAQELGISSISISLAHTDMQAVAVVMALKGD